MVGVPETARDRRLDAAFAKRPPPHCVSNAHGHMCGETMRVTDPAVYAAGLVPDGVATVRFGTGVDAKLVRVTGNAWTAKLPLSDTQNIVWLATNGRIIRHPAR